MRLLAALAVTGSVVGCGDAPKNLFFDQTWSVTELSIAYGMAGKPESGIRFGCTAARQTAVSSSFSLADGGRGVVPG
jgi:hypothetical protein